MLKVDMEYTKGVLFVRLNGFLNHQYCYKLNNYLVPVILKHKIKYLVYNMYLLEDIDSCGLEAITNSKCAIKANKGKIIICEVPKDVKKIIKCLKIKETESELSAIKLLRI